ncbi:MULTISPECIES: hypothetical protein [unclassified Microcoleus]|uniref:hypothetical protein n=1 Tax=unclassified Microcoleus TaxID=2642155 RepID=UPI002FD4302F
MLDRAYNLKLEAVGKIDIRDNLFIGFNAIVLRNVTIGPNAIVAAGAVVAKDVAQGDIVAGVPARPIGRVEDLVKKLPAETQSLPWADLIDSRQGSFDPEIEPDRSRKVTSVALLRQHIHSNCGAIPAISLVKLIGNKLKRSRFCQYLFVYKYN